MDEARAYYNQQKQGNTEDLDFLFQDLGERLKPLIDKIKKFYAQTFKLGSSKVLDQHGNVLKLEEPEYEEELNALANDNLQYVKNITEEQRRILKTEIANGIKKGLSFKEVGDNILKKTDDFTLNRAVLIANTETLKAHSYAQEKTMVDNGIQKFKWVSANDARTAPLDKSLHGHIFEFGLVGTMRS